MFLNSSFVDDGPPEELLLTESESKVSDSVDLGGHPNDGRIPHRELEIAVMDTQISMMNDQIKTQSATLQEQELDSKPDVFVENLNQLLSMGSYFAESPLQCINEEDHKESLKSLKE